MVHHFVKFPTKSLNLLCLLKKLSIWECWSHAWECWSHACNIQPMTSCRRLCLLLGCTEIKCRDPSFHTLAYLVSNIQVCLVTSCHITQKQTEEELDKDLDMAQLLQKELETDQLWENTSQISSLTSNIKWLLTQTQTVTMKALSGVPTCHNRWEPLWSVCVCVLCICFHVCRSVYLTSLYVPSSFFVMFLLGEVRHWWAFSSLSVCVFIYTFVCM